MFSHRFISSGLVVALAAVALGRVAPNPEVEVTLPPAPPFWKKAETARYIVHESNWTSIGTISTHSPIVGYPFASVFSMADTSDGTPLFYITALDLTVQDLMANPSTTIAMTLAQSNYCFDKGVDPENPTCSHTMLSGEMLEITNPIKVIEAKRTLFARHPEMETWPAGHNFFCAELNITHIYLQDIYGRASEVDPADYHAVTL